MENKLMVTEGETWWGRINQKLGMNIHTRTANVRQTINKDLLYSTGKSTQYSVITT